MRATLIDPAKAVTIAVGGAIYGISMGAFAAGWARLSLVGFCATGLYALIAIVVFDGPVRIPARRR